MITAILITGCTRGLGRELAKNLASRGSRVYAVGRTQDELLSLSKESALITIIQADINSAIDRKKILEIISDKEKNISIIHNAGIATPEIFSKLTEEGLRQHMETNCIAPLLLTQLLLPFLTEGQRILNITSGAASIPQHGLLPYCISKAAMQYAMTCLNDELSGKVYCGNVRPGLMDTSMVNAWFELDASKLSKMDYYRKAKESGYMISPVLAAKFIAWILMDTENNEFSETVWSIYDEKHHMHWLTKNDITPEVPK